MSRERPKPQPRRGILENGVFSFGLVLAACLIAYGPSLRYGFVSDDLHLIVDRLPAYERALPLAEAFTQSFWKGGAYGGLHGESKDYYRPLVTLSYALDARVWHGRAAGFHCTNLLLHAVASWLLLRILLGLGARPPCGVAAALLFAVHPVHVTNVSWISGRTDLLCAVFLLLAVDRLIVSVQASLAGGAAAASRDRALWTGVPAFLCALLSKEMAIVLPGLLLLVILLLRVRLRHSTQKAPGWPWMEFSVVAVVAVAYVAFRAAVLGLPDLQMGARSDLIPIRWAMLPAVLVYYWKVFLIPHTLQLDVSFRPVVSIGDPRVLIGLVILALQLTASIRLLRRGQIVGLGLAWILVSLLPVSHLVPLAFRGLVTEYWAYVPSVGFVMALAGAAPIGMRWLARRGRTAEASERPTAIAFAVLALAWMIWIPWRSAPLRSEETSLTHAVRVDPDRVEAWINLASLYGSRGDLQRGLDCIGEAVRRGPGVRGVQLTLGNLYDLSGRTDSAAAAFRREIRSHPESDEARASLADICLRKGDFGEAAQLYEVIVRNGRLSTEDLIGRARQIGASSADPRTSLAWARRQEGLRMAAGTLASLHAARVSLDAPTCLDWLEMELRLGRLDVATRALDAARTAAPAPPADRIAGPAMILALLRDEPGAVERAVNLWKTDPGAAGHASELMGLYGRTGRSTLAIPGWRSLLRGGLANPDELNHVAVLALKGGEEQPADAAGAARIWSMLLEEIPDQPLALLNLGGIAYSAGNRTECRARWTRFLSLYPDRAEAASVRQKLAGL
jgi:protein O-mannosyl-transferase